jgi:hypothetical protein
VAGVDPTDTISVAGSYHVVTGQHRNTGTHLVIGFRIRTRDAGLYEAKLFFLTDVVEGSSSLRIRVEDVPRTSMRCRAKGHFGCFVRPNSAYKFLRQQSIEDAGTPSP